MSKKTTVLIAGGTGLVGKSLSAFLIGKGYDVVVLTRSPKQGTNGITYAHWDPARQIVDPEAIKNADHIINLAGANMGEKRWTPKRKKEIIESRVHSGETLVKALKEIPNVVKTVVNASAIGWYGSDPVIPNPQPFTEDLPPADGFLGESCRLWEASIDPVTGLGKRLVKLRMGIVLSREGGALPHFEMPLRFGVATILGSGRQFISWIHPSDLCRMMLFVLENNTVRGTYNAVSPQPVTNRTLVHSLARRMRGKYFISVRVPSIFLKWFVGELSIEVLKSTTVGSQKIIREGFWFEFGELEKALEQLYG